MSLSSGLNARPCVARQDLPVDTVMLGLPISPFNCALVSAALVIIYLSWRRLGHRPMTISPDHHHNRNYGQIFDLDGWGFRRHLWEEFPAVVKIHAFLGDIHLSVTDPAALYSILVKDQAIFEETKIHLASGQLVFGNGLLSTQGLSRLFDAPPFELHLRKGEHHRKQRKLLNPLFGTQNVRSICPIAYSVARQLRAALVSKIQDGPREIDILEWLSRSIMEFIGRGALGHTFDGLTKETQDPFGIVIKQLLPALSVTRLWRELFALTGSVTSFRYLIENLPNKSLQSLLNIVGTMNHHAEKILLSKKVAAEQGEDSALHQIDEGKDILSKLLQANMNADDDEKLPFDELVAQVSTIVFAGVNTTSSSLGRIVHLLAEHQDVQDKVRAEIAGAQRDGQDMSYDELAALPYLEAVCRESLRRYPAIPIVAKTARKDTIMPLSVPIVGLDGKRIDEIPILMGTTVLVDIMGMNCSRALWGEDALEWKPERWMHPMPQTVLDAPNCGIYAHMLTFLGGGRACIGYKIAQLNIKVFLSMLITSFKLSLSDAPIFWNSGGGAYPSAEPRGTKSELRLNVELIR
ncbi:hypothetical protein CERSUDRAFT_94672 [Gelatoporia subvermispora B]|uniref:Cytochrome P450 n=1 Tax=Ceriporiopsis subvermispora (strain B) TaxID=914234 RepID=M2RFR9_CERS8|nr:hypothetical protein CERSUDRAFT_94672 [Gelatoporia subvermispora B]